MNGGGSISDCHATDINTSFPSHFTAVPDAVYYLTFQITENGNTSTTAANFNSAEDGNIHTYTSVFGELLKAADLSYLGTPEDNWATIYSLIRLDVNSNTLSGVDSTKFGWSGQVRSIDILILETPSGGLQSVGGLDAVDLYSMFVSSDGNPTVIHSCGYGDDGTTLIGV